jgi:hypothetical protein
MCYYNLIITHFLANKNTYSVTVDLSTVNWKYECIPVVLLSLLVTLFLSTVTHSGVTGLLCTLGVRGSGEASTNKSWDVEVERSNLVVEGLSWIDTD